MPRTPNALALLLLPATLAGCCSPTPPHTASPATAPTPSQDATPHTFLHTDTFTTSLTPVAAANGVEAVFSHTFGFQIASYGGYPNGGDRFSATTGAVSAMDQPIKATFRWRSEHETTADFQSDLPPDQHAYVLHAIQAALASANPHPTPVPDRSY